MHVRSEVVAAAAGIAPQPAGKKSADWGLSTLLKHGRLVLTAPRCRARRDMSNGRLFGLATFEPSPSWSAQALELAPMSGVNSRVSLVHAPKAQVGQTLLRYPVEALSRIGSLLELRAQDVAAVRVAREDTCPDHQALFVRDQQSGLDAKLAALSGFPFLVQTSTKPAEKREAQPGWTSGEQCNAVRSPWGNGAWAVFTGPG